ncbi:unnamed protein product, partial [Tetraodon nigroviridis]
FQVDLKSGTNILYWRTTGIVVGGKMVKPVLLKNIQIQGELSGTINRHGNAQRACCFLQVSPTLPSVSRAVPAGSARRLAPPPANRVPATPSPPRGRPRARRVPSTTSRVRTGGKATTRKRVTYKPVFPSPTLPGEGWAECKLRPPCSQKDFFQIHTACDGEGKVGSLRRSHTPTSTHRLSGVCVWFEQTQVLYRWVEPKICLENTSGAAALPPLGPREPCPPCNPGYRSGNDSACLPCPPGTHSDGTGECTACPAGSEPVLGYEYKWWNVLPPNMKSSCFNAGNSKCDHMNGEQRRCFGWEVAGDHIRSGAGSSDNDYLILTLHVPGFKVPASLSGLNDEEFGQVAFVFETICSADCELYFMMDVDRKSTTVVEAWEGSRSKQSFSHAVTRNVPVTYTWAFQRTNRASDMRRYIDDTVKVYSISVSNALDGVASSCRACALVSLNSSCIPCPAGFFIAGAAQRCRECPPDTYLSGRRTSGQDACVACGPGSVTNKEHSFCYSDCSFTYSGNNRTMTFDLRAMSNASSLTVGPSFTSKGTKYLHVFNISLCGDKGRRGAVCSDNVTGVSSKEEQSAAAPSGNLVESFICQSTIVPADGRTFRASVASQSVSLADTFIGATVDAALDGIDARPDLFPDSPRAVPDIHFYYRSRQATASCDQGRSSVVTVRCNPEKSERGGLSVPSSCLAGTCDGCTFHFLWESAAACPRCSRDDYHRIEGACKGGLQVRSSPCEAVALWMMMAVGAGAFGAALLVSLTCYFWKKNQRLEYKYSRLVMAASKDHHLIVVKVLRATVSRCLGQEPGSTGPSASGDRSPSPRNLIYYMLASIVLLCLCANLYFHGVR